uniref:Enoyl reductase (ER) domain-containing protein n=2 Tax=Phytophthora ramorum TaxID=164328 RepID=H3H7E8_PHYRM
MSAAPRTVNAYAAFDKTGECKPWQYEARPLGDADVEIKISHCGICGSDVHTLDSVWGPSTYPSVAGHEIIGEVTAAGPSVKNLAVGDRVGVGAQAWACLNRDPNDNCRECADGQDALCDGIVWTTAGAYKDGARSLGGFADYIRVDSNYAFKIPDVIPSDVAAPLLCAGATVFTPLSQEGVKAGDRVGVIGIGGLGHVAIQFIRALGATPVAFSRSANKEKEIRSLGAEEFYNLNPDELPDELQHWQFCIANDGLSRVTTVLPEPTISCSSTPTPRASFYAATASEAHKSVMTVLQPSESASLVSPANETKQPRYSTFPSASDDVDQTKQRLHDAQFTPGTAPLWSRLFFSYANPMMSAGNTRQLNNEDLWELEGENRSAAAFDEFVEHFERHDKSIIKAMVAAYGGRFLLCGLAMLFTTACNVFAPAVLNHVITVFAAPQIDMYNLSAWLSVFFGSRLVNAIVMSHMHFYLELIALRLTVTLKALLFRKAMRRSIQSKGDAKAVDISNLYSSDVDNVLWAAFQINSLWIIPIQIVVVVYMLYAVIDMAAFAGLAVIASSMLVSFIIAKLSGSTFEDIMKHKDERMKTIKEVFNAIQIVKLNAWEDKFADKIHKLRATELSAVKRFMYLGALNIFVLWASPLAVSAVSFAVYAIVMERALTAAKVFTAIALFNALRDPLRDLPTVIQTCIQAKISINRFSDYLSLDEFQPTNVTRDDSSQPEDVVMAIEDGTFGWTKDTALLSKVNLTIKRGDLVIVHGSVGSGKSSLCSALLGEMDKLAGSVFVRDRVAYYSQQTWIQNMTIRDNILFGLPYDKEKYSRVIAACGLLPDLRQFPGGDSTEIGQKGVNLSGGQKARVCLARACYSDANILLLDSPLAAVDAIVQSQIFGECICNLLAEKTVVLVTHSADIIASEAANMKVLVEDGKLTATRHHVAMPRLSYTLAVSLRSAHGDDSHDGENQP